MYRKLVLIGSLVLLLASALPFLAAQSPLPAPVLSASGLTVSWSAIEGADVYTVRHRVATGGWEYTGVVPPTTSLSFPNLAYGTDLMVEARAAGPAGGRLSEWSNRVTVRRAQPIKTPLARPVVMLNGRVASWSVVADAGSYTLRHRLGDGDWRSLTISAVASPSISFPDLKYEVVREIQVKAVPSASLTMRSDSEWSASVMLRYMRPPPTAVLAGPDNLRHEGSTLSWDAVASAVRYSVSVEETLGRGGAKVYSASGTSFAVPDAQVGKVYVLQVQSIGDGVNFKIQGGASAQYFLEVLASPGPGADDGTGVQSEGPGERIEPAPSGGGKKPSGGSGPSEPGGEPTDEPGEEPTAEPTQPRVCNTPCSASSGSWTVSFVTDKIVRYPFGVAVCAGRTVTRRLQEFTCRNECTGAVTRKYNKVLSESRSGWHGVDC